MQGNYPLFMGAEMKIHYHRDSDNCKTLKGIDGGCFSEYCSFSRGNSAIQIEAIQFGA